MTDPVVYKSGHRVVLDAWAEARAKLTAYIAASKAVIDAHGLGERDIYRATNSWSYGLFRGIGPLPGEAKPPQGWRANRQCLVPDNRTATGRAISQAMNRLDFPGHPGRHVPGMPGDVLLAGGSLVHPRMHEFGGVLWAEWPQPIGGHLQWDDRPAVVDLDLWKPARLSEFYAAKEAAEDAKKSGAAA